MTQPPPRPGQRCTSDLEPELGLGTIAACDARFVTVQFSASDTIRRYATADAPLSRARFKIGDRVAARTGQSLTVAQVEEKEGLLVYHGDGGSLVETELADWLAAGTPLDRLLAGRIQPCAAFDLRLELLEARRRALGSPARGFVGGRMGLIPHQIYIAREVTRRHEPRVLLADEVGLGKTIEACLILHQLLVSGRITRALVLVPEALLHQWLVELMRRFSLRFSLYDEDRCRSIERDRPGDNPFLDDQLVLTSTRFLTRSSGRLAQAAAAGWDLLVVDEAHHLSWAPGAASPEYSTVETLAASAKGLLLLTATPEQLGLPGHFARLRLLDPARHADLERFLAETLRYRDVAGIADALLAGRPLTAGEESLLREILAEDSPDLVPPGQPIGQDPAARAALLDALIDRHGPGRVMFRNTRRAMTGFPGRQVKLAPLHFPEGTRAPLDLDPPGRHAPDLEHDPRLPWLVDLLAALDPEKVLLLCRSRGTAASLDEALRSRTRVKTALFHEGLSLVQRDRNAAHFADPRGARLLLCSEIGSEGRNFQFAHHLVLFDLPVDPDLLEQRIGRLDRIGQTRTIHLHVPWVEGSAHDVLVGWHHRALDDLERSLRGGHRMLELFGKRVRALAGGYRGRGEQPAELEALVGEARTAREALELDLEQSRDHLIELNSFRPDEAGALIGQIRAIEADPRFRDLALRLFEHFGIYAEEIAPGTYRFNAEALTSDGFPELDPGDTVVTFDRDSALLREDWRFLTSDHPLFVRAADLFLGGTTGTSAHGRRDGEPGSMVLEAIFLLECIAPAALHTDRFLATTPIRVAVDLHRPDAAGSRPGAVPGKLVDAGGSDLVARPELYRERLTRLLERGQQRAEEIAETLRLEGLERARGMLQAEAERLRDLARVNPVVRAEEIAAAERELERVSQAIAGARLRLDALRLIKGPDASR